MPNRGEETLACLEEMDAVVRTYRRGHLPGEGRADVGRDLPGGYPRLDEFATFIDPAFRSRFWRG